MGIWGHVPWSGALINLAVISIIIRVFHDLQTMPVILPFFLVRPEFQLLPVSSSGNDVPGCKQLSVPIPNTWRGDPPRGGEFSYHELIRVAQENKSKLQITWNGIAKRCDWVKWPRNTETRLRNTWSTLVLPHSSLERPTNESALLRRGK